MRDQDALRSDLVNLSQWSEILALVSANDKEKEIEVGLIAKQVSTLAENILARHDEMHPR